MSTSVGIGVKGIRTVAVPVSNHDRALDFYVGKLGFEKRLDAPFGQGLRWVEVAPAGSSITIALAPPGDDSQPGRDTGIRLSTKDAVADHARLQEAGVVVGEILRVPGVPPMFYFRDADRNRLYVVEG